jgi:hypothetical protein
MIDILTTSGPTWFYCFIGTDCAIDAISIEDEIQALKTMVYSSID